MPEDKEDKSALPQAQRDKFREWLKKKGHGGPCTVCGSNKWTIGRHLLSGMTVSGAGLNIGGAIYPTAFIVCDTCFYVRQFMAVPIGLVEDDKPEDASDG